MLNPNCEPRPEPHDDPLPELRSIASDKLADLVRHWEGYVGSKAASKTSTFAFFAKVKKVGPTALKPGPEMREMQAAQGRPADWLRVTLEIAAEIGIFDPGYHTQEEGLARVERMIVLAQTVRNLAPLMAHGSCASGSQASGHMPARSEETGSKKAARDISAA